MTYRTHLILGLLLALALLLPGPALAKRGKKKKSGDPEWKPQSVELEALPAPTGLDQLKSGGKVGVGLNLGSRTGLTLKLWPKRPHGISLDIGATNFTNTISLALSYGFHLKPMRAPKAGISAQVYLGIGARARVLLMAEPEDPDDPESETSLQAAAVVGLRVPVGITFLMEGFPVELFLEAAPAIDVWQSLGFDLEGMGGARIYF